jgi:hypothetical protein
MKISAKIEQHCTDIGNDKRPVALVTDIMCVRTLEVNGKVEGFALLTDLGYHDFLVRCPEKAAFTAVNAAMSAMDAAREIDKDSIHLSYVLFHAVEIFGDLDAFVDAVKLDQVNAVGQDRIDEHKQSLKDNFGILN